MGVRQLPKCKRKDCEHNINGRCRILTSTEFKDKCSFFKAKEKQKL